eukprot:3004800-Amphidinium_carterae.1
MTWLRPSPHAVSPQSLPTCQSPCHGKVCPNPSSITSKHSSHPWQRQMQQHKVLTTYRITLIAEREGTLTKLSFGPGWTTTSWGPGKDQPNKLPM